MRALTGRGGTGRDGTGRRAQSQQLASAPAASSARQQCSWPSAAALWRGALLPYCAQAQQAGGEQRAAAAAEGGGGGGGSGGGGGGGSGGGEGLRVEVRQGCGEAMGGSRRKERARTAGALTSEPAAVRRGMSAAWPRMAAMWTAVFLSCGVRAPGRRVLALAQLQRGLLTSKRQQSDYIMTTPTPNKT